MTISSAGRLTRSPSASLPLLIEMQSSLTSISTLLTLRAARRIDIDSVRARNVVVGRDVHAVDGHILRIQDVQAPHRLLAQFQVSDAHALAVLEADHARTAHPWPRRCGGALLGSARRLASSTAARQPLVAASVHRALASEFLDRLGVRGFAVTQSSRTGDHVTLGCR